MKLSRPNVVAMLLAGVVVVCVTVLAVLHQNIPEILSTVALVALGIGGGAALPRGTSTADTVADPAPVVIPEQRAVAGQPVATHAP